MPSQQNGQNNSNYFNFLASGLRKEYLQHSDQHVESVLYKLFLEKLQSFMRPYCITCPDGENKGGKLVYLREL